MVVTCGGVQFRLPHGRGDGCDLWKLTDFNSYSRFELNAQIHLKQVPSSGGVGGDEHEDEDS
ncbi:hypothetical protein Taro_034186 [Colocasia esculenta]|uniref:Uncharacterized protein n=1 Tax=Colocasia esculenta TaxID=4460 RepID=A0A843VVS6_COLES|nr:hypothetical protein [Colocasia esculenta]